MDPLTTLHLINDLIHQSEIEEAKYAAKDLEKWFVRGGSYPELSRDDQKMVIMALLNAIHYAE